MNVSAFSNSRNGLRTRASGKQSGGTLSCQLTSAGAFRARAIILIPVGKPLLLARGIQHKGEEGLKGRKHATDMWFPQSKV